MVNAETIRPTFTRDCGVQRRVTSKEPEDPALARSALVTFQPLAKASMSTGFPRLPAPASWAVQPLLMLCPMISSNGAVALLTRRCMAVAVLEVTSTVVVGSAGGAAMAEADTGAAGLPPDAESSANRARG